MLKKGIWKIFEPYPKYFWICLEKLFFSVFGNVSICDVEWMPAAWSPYADDKGLIFQHKDINIIEHQLIRNFSNICDFQTSHVPYAFIFM